MTVPYWVEDAIFYQIFPDRFARGDHKLDRMRLQSWEAAPSQRGFHGGDLRGIIHKFDYLLDLGITAIYLNPIFQSTSNHRYNTTDYYRIDPKLGSLKDFQALLEIAHRHNVRLILDGVFNHCGRSFFAFADLLENQEQSLYKDWFHVQHFPVDAYSPGEATDYLAWWNHKSLPKFNTTNPQVRKYILEIARYWIEQGIDGWRLDVPNEIDDDSFWAEFRQVVKTINPDAYLVGEIWEINPRWVGDTHFDGLMNYPVRDAILGFCRGDLTPTRFFEQIQKIISAYPHENLYAMYLPLSSHDTERALTLLKGDLKKLELALLFQFAFPGAPAIYYGDEIGLEGGKDPDCRRTFLWEEHRWKTELRELVQKLIHLRKRYGCLRRGNFKKVYTDDAKGCFAFSRALGEERILVVMNGSAHRRYLRLPVAGVGWRDGQIIHNLVGDGEYFVEGDEVNISLPPFSAAWLA